jgi:1-acyl-sn-glycerol-3-phosphate acyltransferase
MDFWYKVLTTSFGTYLTLFVHPIHIEGRENLPKGPKIVVANHSSTTDSFVLPWIFPEKLHFLAQSELFTLPVAGKVLTWADQIPVFKGRGQEALAAAREKLSQGKNIALFPEGTLNHGNGLQRAHTGAARLALQSDAPLVPIGIFSPPKYTHPIRSHLFGRQTLGGWQVGGPCFVHIGEPMHPPREDKIDDSSDAINNLTVELMSRIERLVQGAARAFQLKTGN